MYSAGSFTLENCSVSQNQSCGIYINSLYSRFILNKTFINENKDYAFILQRY